MTQPDPPGPQPDPEGQPRLSLEALEQQLAETQAEIERYRSLIEALPELYETKFGQQLQQLNREILRLQLERRALKVTLAQRLEAAEEPRALPAASALPRHWPRWILVAALACGAVAALVVWAGRRPQPQLVQAPPAAPRPAKPPPRPAPALVLRARGEAWLEVRRAGGEVLFVGTLAAGQERRWPLAKGLEVRSGRADLLEVAADQEPPEPLGRVQDLGWRRFTAAAPGS